MVEFLVMTMWKRHFELLSYFYWLVSCIIFAPLQVWILTLNVNEQRKFKRIMFLRIHIWLVGQAAASKWMIRRSDIKPQ